MADAGEGGSGNHTSILPDSAAGIALAMTHLDGVSGLGFSCRNADTVPRLHSHHGRNTVSPLEMQVPSQVEQPRRVLRLCVWPLRSGPEATAQQTRESLGVEGLPQSQWPSRTSASRVPLWGGPLP